MKARWLPVVMLAAAICSPVWILAAAQAAKTSDEGGSAKEPVLLCPVSGKPASKTATVDYHGGKVFLCCEGCRGKFEKDTAKYATKANFQLAASGQAKQVACPFSGRPVNPKVSATVAGVKVGFCCNGCKAKFAKADAKRQIELAFSSEAFDKAFKIPKKATNQEKKE